jgi:predicted ribosomally synthesized peptide with nif11-like leader
MEKMKELYQKVAADPILRNKYKTILQETGKTEADENEKKLLAFAKEAGYDVTFSEMLDFFKDMSDPDAGELSESELDMVAGGKGNIDESAWWDGITDIGFGPGPFTSIPLPNGHEAPCRPIVM